jgi:hypothetical protein
MPRKREDETDQQRLQKILHGAFAGPSPSLKDIPTSEGKVRRISGKPQRHRRVVHQRKKRAA